MEHILQFAISIDEDRIIKLVEEKATKTGIDRIDKAVEERTKQKNHWTPAYIDTVINDKLDVVIKENKDDIIEKAAERLAEKLVRTKAVKEKVAEVLGSTIG